MSTPEFKVGDRVREKGYEKVVGTIVGIIDDVPWPWEVLIDGNGSTGLYQAEKLELMSNDFDKLKEQLRAAQEEVKRLEKQLEDKDNPNKYDSGIFVGKYEHGENWVFFKNQYAIDGTYPCLSSVDSDLAHQDFTCKFSDYIRLTGDQNAQVRQFILRLVGRA